MRRAFRIAARFIVALALLIVFYLIAAVGSALLPVAGRPQNAQGEPIIYVCTSLAHADIMMPARDPLIDWASFFPTVALPSLPAEAYLSIGWGDQRFFRETPRWADVKISTALGALAGLNDTTLRIIAVNPPEGDLDCLPLEVDRAGRQALIDHIRASLSDDGSPQPWPVAQTGVEAYYLAKGRYSPLRTCNQWVAEALAAAGLPHTRFAPFSFSIVWPLQRQPTH